MTDSGALDARAGGRRVQARAHHTTAVDLRYVGQFNEVEVPLEFRGRSVPEGARADGAALPANSTIRCTVIR